MIGLVLSLCPGPSWGETGGCPEEGILVVTAPRPGARTSSDSIAVRGFLCQDYHLVLVTNRTTERSVIASTDRLCDGGGCVYTFATYIRDLALGENDLTALVPGQDPPIEVSVRVLRTAFAQR